jgi:hypothetical protein
MNRDSGSKMVILDAVQRFKLLTTSSSARDGFRWSLSPTRGRSSWSISAPTSSLKTLQVQVGLYTTSSTDSDHPEVQIGRDSLYY